MGSTASGGFANLVNIALSSSSSIATKHLEMRCLKPSGPSILPRAPCNVAWSSSTFFKKDNEETTTGLMDGVGLSATRGRFASPALIDMVVSEAVPTSTEPTLGERCLGACFAFSSRPRSVHGEGVTMCKVDGKERILGAGELLLLTNELVDGGRVEADAVDSLGSSVVTLVCS